jgi:phytanoyl-CoA hydroxylase
MICTTCLLETIVSLTVNQRPSETTATAKYPYTENFRYTLNNHLLSQDQRKFYEENGYLVIPYLIEDELLDECW